MSIFAGRTTIAFVAAGVGALLLASPSRAEVPVAPLKGQSTITEVAQGCGPGRWRNPAGLCVGPGYGYGPGYGHYGYGHYGYGQRCWRDMYGVPHCRW